MGWAQSRCKLQQASSLFWWSQVRILRWRLLFWQRTILDVWHECWNQAADCLPSRKSSWCGYPHYLGTLANQARKRILSRWIQMKIEIWSLQLKSRKNSYASKLKSPLRCGSRKMWLNISNQWLKRPVCCTKAALICTFVTVLLIAEKCKLNGHKMYNMRLTQRVDVLFLGILFGLSESHTRHQCERWNSECIAVFPSRIMPSNFSAASLSGVSTLWKIA